MNRLNSDEHVLPSSGDGSPPVHPLRAPGQSTLRALVVFGILLCLLMGALDNFVVLTALPKILHELSASLAEQSFVVSAYLITSTVAVPIFARLSDMYDRKTVFLSGLFIFIAGSVLAGLSQSFPELVAFRAVQGFGSGDFFPVGLAIVAVVFPPETRARVTGFLSGVFGIATVAGPFLGAFIVDNTSWRWVFYVNIPVGLAGLAFLMAALGPVRPERPGRYDVGGSLLLAGWVGTLMFPLVEVGLAGWAWTDLRVVVLLAAALLLIASFVAWELRFPEPLVPLRLLKRRIVGASAGTTFLVGLILFPLATFLTFFITDVTLAGHTSGVSDTVRDVLYALVLPLVVGAAVAGNLLTRVAYRPIVVGGIGLASVGMFFLTFLTVHTPVWKFAYGFLPVGGIILPLIPLGFGIGVTFPVFLLAVQNQVPEAEVGAATGIVQFFQSLGGAMGLALLSSFQQARFTALGPPVPAGGCALAGTPTNACLAYFGAIPAPLAQSYDQLFQLTFVLTLVALLLSTFITGRLPVGKRPETTANPPAVPPSSTEL
ncbi:MAG: MFS transporter [Thermoplasmata archaeon]|nr:MFS transporter [Thermoplasmata archaeon]